MASGEGIVRGVEAGAVELHGDAVPQVWVVEGVFRDESHDTSGFVSTFLEIGTQAL